MSNAGNEYLSVKNNNNNVVVVPTPKKYVKIAIGTTNSGVQELDYNPQQ